MSLADDVKTVLVANATLVSTFSTRIVTWDETGAYGLSRQSYPAAFDASLKLQPTLILRERVQLATFAMRFEVSQQASAVQALEVWFYNERDAGYDAIEAAQGIAYGLLADKTIGNARLLWREHRKMERDKELNMACVVYSVYDGHGVVGP